MSDLDTFSDDARAVFRLAEEHARRTGQNYVGTEHLLLALLDQPDSPVRTVLCNLQVDPDRAREAAEYLIGEGQGEMIGRIRFTPRTVTVIDLTIEEAATLRHQPISPEQILLGLIREQDGIAAGVLDRLGMGLEITRVEVARLRDVVPGTAPAELNLDELADLDRQRAEVLALIDQVRWTPERIATFRGLLESLIASG